jgi:four helix bundle protein
MFDFENLIVYKKAKTFNTAIREFIKTKNLDRTTTDQLRRAAFSVVLNLAEGSGRFSKPDRRNFFIIARSSVFECVAILDVLKDESMVDEITFRGFYNNGDELSRILFAMIKNLEKKR